MPHWGTGKYSAVDPGPATPVDLSDFAGIARSIPAPPPLWISAISLVDEP
jgi:hypothetical protein